MIDFRQITPVCLGYRLLKHKITTCSENFGEWAPAPPDYAHDAGLKNGADKLRKLTTANKALRLVCTKKSELNLNDKDIFPEVCIDVF